MKNQYIILFIKYYVMRRKDLNTYYDDDDDFNFCMAIIFMIITIVYLIPAQICSSIRTSLFS